MSKEMGLAYLFRRPSLPILVDVDSHLLAAKSELALLKKLLVLDLVPQSKFNAVDRQGEGWGVHVYEDQFVVSPLVFKKRWTKLELIRLFNGRKNRHPDEAPYPEKSLSSKTLAKIIADLVQGVLEAEKRR